MKKIPFSKRICICAVCIALCYVLPLAFHAIGAGSAFSPIHLPVFLCGLICGGGYGFCCGLVGTVLSSVLSGMPPAAALVHMVPELCVYGLVSGLIMQFVHTRKVYADVYVSILPAMLLGRVAGGVARALFFLGTDGNYSLVLWASSYFIGSAPAIISQLILLPLLIAVLMRAKLIPARYEAAAKDIAHE